MKDYDKNYTNCASTGIDDHLIDKNYLFYTTNTTSYVMMDVHLENIVIG